MNFQDWARQSDTKKIYLVEMIAVKRDDLSQINLYLASEDVVLADRAYIGAVQGLPRLTRQGSDALEGNSVPTWGELEILIEPDLRPDPKNSLSWSELLSEDYVIEGRPLIIKLGGEGFGPADYVTIFNGYVGPAPQYDDELLTLTIYDKSYLLELLQVPDYIIPDTADVPEGSRGQVIPIPYGRCKNYKPVIIADNTFAVAACRVKSAQVYVNGIKIPSTLNTTPSPPAKEGQGLADMVTSGQYVGSRHRVNWMLEIDSVSAGKRIGESTFRWSENGGESWRESGRATVNYGYNPATILKNPSYGNLDLRISGEYTGGSVLRFYKVYATQDGIPGVAPYPKFIWSDDGGENWYPEVVMVNVGPYPLSHGLVANFYKLGVEILWIERVEGDCGDYHGSLYAEETMTAGLDIRIKINNTARYSFDEINFEWSNDGENWYPGTVPITWADQYWAWLMDDIYLIFGFPYGWFCSGDSYRFITQNIVGQLVAGDTWTFRTSKEVPIPLSDGPTVQFVRNGVGDDFEMGDRWSWILNTSVQALVEDENEVTVDVEGKFMEFPGATGTVTVVAAMTGNTYPAPLVASASHNNAQAWKAFCGKYGPSFQWTATGLGGGPAWLQIGLGAVTTIRGYRLTSPTREFSYGPLAWELQGSNDGGSHWDVLDSRSMLSWHYPQRLEVYFDAPFSYASYRLFISAFVGDYGRVGVGNLELLGWEEDRVYSDRLGDIITDLLVAYGDWDLAEIDTAAMAAFNAAISYHAGLLLDSKESLIEVINRALQGIPALHTMKLNGQFSLIELSREPSGEPVGEFTDLELMELSREREVAERVYRKFLLNYDRCYDTITTSSGVPVNVYGWANTEYRLAQLQLGTEITTIYPLAGELGPLDTCLVSDNAIGDFLNKADVDDLLRKLASLFSSRPHQQVATVPIQPWDPGNIVKLRRDKFGLAGGLNFLLLGLEMDFAASLAEITLWR